MYLDRVDRLIFRSIIPTNQVIIIVYRPVIGEGMEIVSKPDLTTLIAFLFVVIIGGSNAVAVRFSNLELPPFWGAAVRFAGAALIFWVIVFVRRIEAPRGKSLVGAVIFGLLAVGFSYAFLYYGLLRVQAGLTMVVMAFTPLMTLFLAAAHGLEKFRWRGLAGALIALIGIVLGVTGSLSGEIPLLSLLAITAGALCLAEGNVVFKLIPKSHPVATNAVAVSTGAVFLTLLSLVVGEVWVLPEAGNALWAVLYLVIIGSGVLFYLYLFVLKRWTASATSYSFLLFPVSTIIIAALLAGEAVSLSFIIGGLMVMAGVWLGAFSKPKPKVEARDVPASEDGSKKNLDPAR
jgi:drug/metabolite transporter (DMT)-like permease